MSKTRFHLILLAAGYSRRFGGNKLLYAFRGEPLYRRALALCSELMKRPDVVSCAVVSQYVEILDAAEKKGMIPVENSQGNDGMASSVRKGLAASLALPGNPAADAFVFLMADQPLLRIGTAAALLDVYAECPEGILCAADQKRRGNPTVFGQKYTKELLALTGDTGGKQVMKRHPGEIRTFRIPSEELFDIDRVADAEQIAETPQTETDQ